MEQVRAVPVWQIAAGIPLRSANVLVGSGNANVLVGSGNANVLVGLRMRWQWCVVHGFFIGFFIRYADGDVGVPRADGDVGAPGAGT